MEKVLPLPFKYGLTFNLIEKTSMFFFFGETFWVLGTCLLLFHPTLIKDGWEKRKNDIYIIFVFINIIGNYMLASTSNNKYKGYVMHEPPKTWHYCPKCSQHSPPRSHHCSLCKACVKKQDHHCFFISQCVGLCNQRFFIPFLLYVSLGSFHCLKLVFAYLNIHYIPFTFSFYGFFSYLFFGAIYNWLFVSDSEVQVTLGIFMLVFLLYTNICLSIGTFCFFVAQIFLTLRGQTPHEFGKSIYCYDHGMRANFYSVFGKWSLLHFVLPIPVRYREPKECLEYRNFV